MSNTNTVKSPITISSDKSKLDRKMIHAFISNAYWGKGRSEAATDTCIEHSLNFGLYLQETQIGYARVVTDYAQFAYLMDVFISEAQRGKGFSKLLLEHILQEEQLKDVKVWRLATSDAHELYRQFGFTDLKDPGKLMERISA